jgi:hypothetical protein
VFLDIKEIKGIGFRGGIKDTKLTKEKTLLSLIPSISPSDSITRVTSITFTIPGRGI